MAGEKLLLATALALARPPGDVAAKSSELQKNEQLLVKLLELQRRVRAGEEVTVAELALGGVEREELLRELDVRGAMRLGVEPRQLLDRINPGFTAELDSLAEQRLRLDAGPPNEPSPLLTLVLDLEIQLRAVADRRRQGLGLRNPLESPALTTPIQPNGSAGPAVIDGVDLATPPSDPSAALARAKVEPAVAAATYYRAGRYEDALKEWARLPDSTPLTAETRHQFADALLRSGRIDEAIDRWRKLVEEQKDSPWGHQAAFSLELARTLATIEKARADADARAKAAKGDGS
jgi:tetratricopeptide (TPR) repeat protein